MSATYRELQRAAAELVITTQHGSAGMLRRQLEIPWSRAQALMVDLEEQGIVGPLQPDAGRARDVKIPFAGVPELHRLIDAAFPRERPRCRDCSDMGLPPCKGTC